MYVHDLWVWWAGLGQHGFLDCIPGMHGSIWGCVLVGGFGGFGEGMSGTMSIWGCMLVGGFGGFCEGMSGTMSEFWGLVVYALCVGANC